MKAKDNAMKPFMYDRAIRINHLESTNNLAY